MLGPGFFLSALTLSFCYSFAPSFVEKDLDCSEFHIGLSVIFYIVLHPELLFQFLSIRLSLEDSNSFFFSEFIFFFMKHYFPNFWKVLEVSLSSHLVIFRRINCIFLPTKDTGIASFMISPSDFG